MLMYKFVCEDKYYILLYLQYLFNLFLYEKNVYMVYMFIAFYNLIYALI